MTQSDQRSAGSPYGARSFARNWFQRQKSGLATYASAFHGSSDSPKLNGDIEHMSMQQQPRQHATRTRTYNQNKNMKRRRQRRSKKKKNKSKEHDVDDNNDQENKIDGGMLSLGMGTLDKKRASR
jgi:hypothetical protein